MASLETILIALSKFAVNKVNLKFMNKKLKKEIIEWSVILTVLALLITTGLGAKVASFLQRGIIQTGLMTPDLLTEEEYLEADYDFKLSDENANLINFKSYKGKTIFINFWATWCPPCVAEMPDINELHAELTGNENIVFIMISMDKERQTALQFKENYDLDLPIYFLESRIPDIYDTHSIPTTYVISPEGKIVSQKHGMAKYNSEKFKKFLKGL